MPALQWSEDFVLDLAPMDAALAAHLHRVGYDPETGAIHTPQALPDTEIHGCAGDSCSDTESTTESELANA